MPDLEPITRDEMLWSGEDLEPITRREMYIRHLYDETQVIPEKPITREEMFILKAGEELHDVTIEQLNVSENGTYSESGKAYSPVIVNVPAPPLPDNAYLLKEVEDLPKDIATFNDGTALPMPSLKTTIVPIQSGSGDPSPSNVRPISGWSGANVSVCGTNVWDEEWESGEYNISNGNKVNSTGVRCKNKIRIKGNTSYYVYIRNNTTNNFGYCFYDADGNFISGSVDRSGINLTTPSNACYLTFFAPNSWYGSTYNNDISINYPSTDTSYHAYNGHTYNIPFQDSQGNPIEVFGGECDVVNGTSGNVKTLASVDLGTLNWALENGVFRLNESIGAKLTTDTSAVANMLCSVYKTVSQNAMGLSSTDHCIAGLNWSNGVRVKDSDYTTASDFKTAMNGVQLVYELATPSTFTSQPTSIKSIEGTNNVWGDCGQIKEGSYFAESEEE